MFKRADQDAFDRMVKQEPVLKQAFDACGKWFENDST
jgi:hypothetical protein